MSFGFSTYERFYFTVSLVVSNRIVNGSGNLAEFVFI